MGRVEEFVQVGFFLFVCFSIITIKRNFLNPEVMVSVSSLFPVCELHSAAAAASLTLSGKLLVKI